MLDYRVDFDELNNYANSQPWADRWHEKFGYRPETEPAVAQLVRLAHGGDILGTAVGCGRHVLPLIGRCSSIEVIERHEAMLNKLKQQPNSDQIVTHLGDPADMRLEKTFDLVFNLALEIQTILTVDKQQEFFFRASEHLKPGGFLVVECMNPSGYKLAGQCIHIMRIIPGEVTLSCEVYHPEEHIFTQAFVFLKDQQTPDVYTAALRWNERSELVQLGRNAGLELVEVWQNWDGTPAEEKSPMCIHIFQKP